MVKAKDFWDLICTKLDYRFFSGVPSIELRPLYDTMSPEIMHYVPAIDDYISLGLTAGAFLSGYKSAVLISPDKIKGVMVQYRGFNEKFNIPTLFITNGLKELVTGFPVWVVEEDFFNLYKADDYLYKAKKGGCIIDIRV